MNNKLILRNEDFGGVYFNQLTGRMVMVDREGFLTLLKYLKKENLNGEEELFSKFFFRSNFPKEVELRINPTITAQPPYSVLVTKTPVLIDLSLNNYCNLNCSYNLCSLVIITLSLLSLYSLDSECHNRTRHKKSLRTIYPYIS